MNIPFRIFIFDAARQCVHIIRVLFTEDISVEGILYSQGNQLRSINNLATILNPSPTRAGKEVDIYPALPLIFHGGSENLGIIPHQSVFLFPHEPISGRWYFIRTSLSF